MRNLMTIDEYTKKLFRDPGFRREYELLDPQYQLLHEIIKARIETGISQKELAEKTGLSFSTIYRIEFGLVSPRLDTVGKIARGFGKKLQIRFVSR